MSSTPIATASLASLLALAGCTANDVATDSPAGTHANGGAAVRSLPPAGAVHWGSSFAEMARQYTPRAGPVAATGASAWVPPAPPPAFVVAGPLPPADPPAPLPAAIANRQPSAASGQPPASAAAVVRPEAAQAETPAPAAADPALRTAGLALFNNYSCGACHAFADAGASGAVGPSLDRKLAVAAIVDVVTHGRGAMPAFGGQMSDAEIRTLADYLAQFSR